ncbi:MAG: carboxylesterase family protein [Caulobacter sp.]|nr:carboxylesterase family protein [Caulobacter sp.]
MIRVTAALAALLLTACATAPEAGEISYVADQATSRTISSGQLVGYVASGEGALGAKAPDAKAHVWRSVPFAKPPVGDLRWRAPRAPEPWTGVRSSLTPAPWCPQVLSALDGVDKSKIGQIVGQEDCLYLDVYAPPMTAQEAADAKLPVMMWIHGGSNTWGRAEQYDGAALAARHKVVVVVVQYRLGPLGWLAQEQLRAGAETTDDASANFGNLDHIRALEWIRQDIAAFGGDPGRVTVFGESAGGHNVAALLASPRAAGLFHRAIVQSGSFRSTPLAEAEGLTGSSKDSGNAAAARIVGAGQAVTGAALRAASMKAVFAAYDTSRAGYNPPRVIADGVVLPAAGLSSGLDSPAAFNAVPVITGSNRDEMKLFNALDPKLATFILGVFPQAKDKPLYEAMSAYPSRLWRADAVDGPAGRMTAGGHAPVWTYRFDWDEEGSLLITDLGQLLGAAHSMEIPFVFGHFKLLGRFDPLAFTKGNAPGRLALSDTMMSYWANFAATGAPGRGTDGTLAEWKAWTNVPAAPALMVFDSPAGGGARMIPGGETPEKVITDLMADPSLKTDARRCEVLMRSTRERLELRKLAGGRCGKPD